MINRPNSVFTVDILNTQDDVCAPVSEANSEQSTSHYLWRKVPCMIVQWAVRYFLEAHSLFRPSWSVECQPSLESERVLPKMKLWASRKIQFINRSIASERAELQRILPSLLIDRIQRIAAHTLRRCADVTKVFVARVVVISVIKRIGHANRSGWAAHI